MSDSQEPETRAESAARKLQSVAFIALQGHPAGDGAREKFSARSAPLVGAIVGAVIGLRGAFSSAGLNQRPGTPSPWQIVVGGAVLGFLGGLLIWFLDRPARPRKASPDPLSPTVYTESDLRALRLEAFAVPPIELNLIGKFCTFSAIVLCWIPIVGLVMAISAFLFHLAAKKKTGWVFRGSVVVSALTTLAVVPSIMKGA